MADFVVYLFEKLGKSLEIGSGNRSVMIFQLDVKIESTVARRWRFGVGGRTPVGRRLSGRCWRVGWADSRCHKTGQTVTLTVAAARREWRSRFNPHWDDVSVFVWFDGRCCSLDWNAVVMQSASNCFFSPDAVDPFWFLRWDSTAPYVTKISVFGRCSCWFQARARRRWTRRFRNLLLIDWLLSWRRRWSGSTFKLFEIIFSIKVSWMQL